MQLVARGADMWQWRVCFAYQSSSELEAQMAAGNILIDGVDHQHHGPCRIAELG
jgi:hypothetical protein